MRDISQSLSDISCTQSQFKERYIESYKNDTNALISRFQKIEENVEFLEKTVERCQDIVKEILGGGEM